MGILQHHAQRPPQGGFFNVPHVDAVIGDGTGLDLIKTVDEAGDGGLARTGGAHEGDLLSRLGEQRDVVQHHLPLIVAKHHMVEPHVAPQGNQLPARLLPGPDAGVEGGLGHGAVLLLCGPHQLDLALVHLRLRLHDLEDALGAGHGGEDGVHLLGYLGDGLAHLPGVLQEGRQIAQSEGPRLDGEDSAHTAGQGVVHIGQVAHDGHHDAAEDLGPGAGLAVGLVELVEALLGRGLVVEDLNDLLTLDHLLDIAVHRAHRFLLSGEIPAAAAADDLDHLQHHKQHGEGH